MRTHSILFAVSLMSASLFSQISVQINSDGTHTVLFQNGNMLTGINPDGTHSVGHINGNMLVISNSNGTQSTGFINGNMINIMHSDGKSSVIHQHGNMAVQSNSDGTQDVIHFHNEAAIELWSSNKIFRRIIKAIEHDEDASNIKACMLLSKYLLLIYNYI